MFRKLYQQKGIPHKRKAEIWQLEIVFAIYAVTSFLAVMWMYFTDIEESRLTHETATFKSSLGLLGNGVVALMVLGIFLSVGAEMGLNSNIANYLKNIFEIPLEKASLVISVYYTALMIGRFLGAMPLNCFNPKKFLIVTSAFALLSLFAFINSPSLGVAKLAIFCTDLGSANLFPIIFAINVNTLPQRSNELSGLMIMAVVGGAIIPPLMGLISVNIGLIYSMYLPICCIAYIFLASLFVLREKAQQVPSRK